MVLLAASFEGYLWRLGQLPLWSRVALGVAGLLLFIPEGYTDLIGAALAIAVVVVMKLTRKSAHAAR